MGATVLRRLAWLVLLPTTGWAQAPEPPAPAPATGEIDIEDPAQCVACHETIVNEWRTSMHARAHHSQDPVYAAMRQLRVRAQGEAVKQACSQCHTPRAPSPDVEGPIATAGVSCASCHNIKAVHAKGVGAQRAERYADNTLIGPNDPREGMVAPHGLAPSPAHFKDGFSICLSCHEQVANPKGVVLCNTGPEFGDAGGAFPQQRCVDCHMPVINGPSGSVDRDQSHPSHALVTAHHRWYWPELADQAPQAVELRGEFSGGRFVLHVENKTGHGYPTGFPGRMALLKLVGKDAAGAPVWTNFETDPMKESPESVFNAVFGDAHGKPTLPPMSARVLRENRLEPGEIRRIDYEVPPAVRSVQATVVYRLIPPPLAKRFALTDAPEGAPRPIYTKAFTRK